MLYRNVIELILHSDITLLPLPYSNYPENIIDKAYVFANRGPKPYTSNEETTSNSIILRLPFIFFTM